MDELRKLSGHQLSLPEQATLADTFGMSVIDFLHKDSVSKAYTVRDEIVAPNTAHTVGVLVSGWVIAQKIVAGDEVVVDTLLPYDVIPDGRLSTLKANQKSSLLAATECRVYWIRPVDLYRFAWSNKAFRKSAFAKLERQSERIAERLRVSTHYGAAPRLAQFILETLDRLKTANAAIYDRFLCPLSQSQVGSLLGITNIHVSRSLSRMEAEGLIKRHKSFIEVVDRDGLRSMYWPDCDGSATTD